jgi:methionine-rich copper-binding protein CopC
VTKSRALARFAVAVAVALVVSVGLVGSASAHDVLISSNPADGATLATVPTTVTFTFDQPVQNFDPVVSLVGPDGKQYATGAPVISGNTVTGTVGAGPAGAYTAAYRIVSADGHPVTGEIHFTLGGDAAPASTGASGDASASGAATPAPSAVVSSGVSGSGLIAGPTSTAGTTVNAAPAVRSAGLSAWLWIGLVVAALVIAVAAVILLRRPGRGADRDY